MEIHATPEQVAKFSRIASEISYLFAENRINRGEGLDVIALVVVSMLTALDSQPKEAHAMADSLAECIKINYDMHRRNFEPLN
jgi:hypothetical protein